MTVQAKDCYDPADYILVHNKFFDGMREAVREAHHRLRSDKTTLCACIYCRVEKASLADSAGVPQK